MSPAEMINDLENRISAARSDAEIFLQECGEVLASMRVSDFGNLPDQFTARRREVSRRFHDPLVRVGALVQRSPMFGNTDLQAVQSAVRRIDAALRLRYLQEWEPEVLHDEGTVLGVRPAGFSEETRLRAGDALDEIDHALDDVSRRLGVLKAEAEALGDEAEMAQRTAGEAVRVRPGTAFIMMMMDPGDPSLEDVKGTIQEEFARVGIRAIRADDIEHSDEITHRILDEIKSAEFLIADLSGARPSVYYEIGYAHAIGRRVILYRRKEERLHFDLAVHNCPEYTNLTDLRDKLRRRIAALTNRDE
jgi:hypothetical protein